MHAEISVSMGRTPVGTRLSLPLETRGHVKLAFFDVFRSKRNVNAAGLSYRCVVGVKRTHSTSHVNSDLPNHLYELDNLQWKLFRLLMCLSIILSVSLIAELLMSVHNQLQFDPHYSNIFLIGPY